MFAPALRQLVTRRLQTAALPVAKRHASTVTPHAHATPHYSTKEWLQRFVPVESYPLIAFVVCMSSFGIYNAAIAFNRPEGELRLAPNRYRRSTQHEPWEDPKALAGKW
ncbi:uncharacterized protein JCM10292_000229 [Rhodotorula paludigena]|uniref:uncharacterized protein n=1 Tax=Rhodotorula paludigena TaxID=86838 RepID=UPI00317CB35D